jgi:hypothetical protein
MRCLTALALLATTLACPAQQATRLIEVRTLCFQHIGDIKKVLVPGTEAGVMTEVPLYISSYSLPQKLKVKEDTVAFVIPDATPENASGHRVIAQAKVPADSTRVLFLFLPGEDPVKEPYKVVTFADDTRTFPWGSVRLINLSKVPVRFHLGEFSGDNAKTLAPGKLTVIPKVRKLNEFNQYNVLIEFQGTEGFVPVSNTRWKTVDGKRDLAIAFVDPAGNRPVVNLYEDIEPAKLP